MRFPWLKSTALAVFASSLTIATTANPALARPRDESQMERPAWSSRAAREMREESQNSRQTPPRQTQRSSADRSATGWQAPQRSGHDWQRDTRGRDPRRDRDPVPAWQNSARERSQTYRSHERYRPQESYRSPEQSRLPANPRPAIRSWSHDRDRDRDYRTSDRWNRDWRRDTRYDWRSHRNRYHQNYRVERYRSPSFGYRYAPLSIGFRLSRPFYAQSYWIDDPWRYRLPDVYGPYQWVRYYDDVLLVDTFNGEVVDVIRDFFW